MDLTYKKYRPFVPLIELADGDVMGPECADTESDQAGEIPLTDLQPADDGCLRVRRDSWKGTQSSLFSRYSCRTGQTVNIDRPVLTQTDFDQACTPASLPGNLTSRCQHTCRCSRSCLRRGLSRFFPFLSILRDYVPRQHLPRDVIAGLTVGIMHIPQGLAYGMLTAVTPVLGLYTSFFPVIVYFFLGTSRHISIGTFAVICLMIGTVVENEQYCSQFNTNNTAQTNLTNNHTYHTISDSTSASLVSSPAHSAASWAGLSEKEMCKIGVATSITMLSGLIQIVLGICQLGFVTIYLSEPLTRGFTTGAACHVLTSQIKHVFGIKVQRFSGPLKLVYIYKELFSNITESNVVSLLITAVCMVLLFTTKELINPRVKKKIHMPVPIELLVVILCTVVSHFASFHTEFKVPVVGEIPTGIPMPSVPPIHYWRSMLKDGFSIAIVCFAVSVSMAKLFAKKHAYEIDSNQELLALGLTNVICCHLHCFVATASLSRSIIQEDVGGHTQIAGLVSCVLLLVVLLAIGPLFQNLPNACLAAIIIVALKGMFMQLADLKKLWSIDKYDFLVWVVAFLSTALLDVDVGLAVGVAFSLFTVIFRTQRPYVCVLGKIPDTEIYKDIHVYDKVQEVKDIKILRFESSLYYANQEHFLLAVYEHTGVNPRKRKAAKSSKPIKQSGEETASSHPPAKPRGENNNLQLTTSTTPQIEEEEESVGMLPHEGIQRIILDCTTMAYTDSGGASTISQLIKDYSAVGIEVYLAGCKATLRSRLLSVDLDLQDSMYLSVHDAVVSAQATLAKSASLNSLFEANWFDT